MTQAQALLHLQQIELAILSDQKRLSEIAAILSDDEQVGAAQRRVQSAEDALAPLRANARNLELEIQANGQKARATEEQLYSGRVKNTKEMQDMQAEIAALKRRNSDLEERLLETMLAAEEAEAALADAQAALEEVMRDRADEKRHLLDEQAQLKAHVAGLRQQREAALGGIAPDDLAKYNALRPRKNNHPVAVLDGSMCTACGVQQTMAIEREARLGQSLVTCLSCGRILVYKL